MHLPWSKPDPTATSIDWLFRRSHFVNTAEGPHFCVVGQKYRLFSGQQDVICIATEITGLGNDACMVFVPIGDTYTGHVGRTPLDRIEDIVDD